MALKQKGTDAAAAASDSKKRRRVGFSGIDAGIEANEYSYLFFTDDFITAKNLDEAASEDCTSIQPFDLNHFFGEDGKIYGYKNLKINVWISAISFHGYADISFDETSDGGKGITDLKTALQSIFGENLVEKAEFLQTFSKECEYIRDVVTNGSAIKHDGTNESDPAVEFRFSLLFKVYSGPKNLEIDLYLITRLFELNSKVQLHSFILIWCRLFCFWLKILVLPPHQGEGHGLSLLEAINSIALSENIYDVTIEDPSDYLQYVRSSIDCLRLLTFDPIKPVLSAMVTSLKETNLSKRTCSLRMVPPADLTETVRQKLKINKKQFLRCWEILIYLSLDSEDRKSMDNFRACIYDRLKSEILGGATGTNGKRLVQIPSSLNEEMSFAVYWTLEGGDAEDQTVEQQPEDLKTQEQQLNELVDNQMEEIVGIAKNVTSRGKDKLAELAAR
nr:unnamed protein product [Digitaria exilis]